MINNFYEQAGTTKDSLRFIKGRKDRQKKQEGTINKAQEELKTIFNGKAC
jgi:hypothetical protein